MLLNDRKVIDRGWLLLYVYYCLLCVYELISRTHEGSFYKNYKYTILCAG